MAAGTSSAPIWLPIMYMAKEWGVTPYSIIPSTPAITWYIRWMFKFDIEAKVAKMNRSEMLANLADGE